MGKASRLRKERQSAAGVLRELAALPLEERMRRRTPLCQCPREIGPHEETDSCRAMQRKFEDWLREKMR